MTSKKNSDKEYGNVLKVWDKVEMKTIKDYQGLHLKCDIFLLADALKNLKIVA